MGLSHSPVFSTNKNMKSELTEEQASLSLCNLVSSGMSVSEARQRLTASGDSKQGELPEKSETRNSLGLPQDAPDTIEGLFSAFAKAGMDQHPNTKLTKLVSLYKKTFPVA